MASMLERANQILDYVCECLAGFDFTQCECFNNNEPDPCCNRIIGVCGVIPECSGVFVNFTGGQPRDTIEPNPCVNLKQATFEVGAVLCPPSDSGKTNATKQLDLWNQYSECIIELADYIWSCLNELTCCNNQEPCGSVAEVIGLQCLETGFVATITTNLG